MISQLEISISDREGVNEVIKFELNDRWIVLMKIPNPLYPKSTLIKDVIMGKHRLHCGTGDMWPMTWAADSSVGSGIG